MNETIDLFVRISINRMLNNYLPKLEAAIRQLDMEALWTHEVQWMNSIGGITLHIEEHLNRHVVRYSKSGKVSGGIEDYFPDIGISPEALSDRISDMFNLWRHVMSSIINGQEVMESLDMHDIYHLVEHTGYHLGQIIDRTQRLTNTQFQFVQNGLNEKSLRGHL